MTNMPPTTAQHSATTRNLHRRRYARRPAGIESMRGRVTAVTLPSKLVGRIYGDVQNEEYRCTETRRCADLADDRPVHGRAHVHSRQGARPDSHSSSRRVRSRSVSIGWKNPSCG